MTDALTFTNNWFGPRIESVWADIFKTLQPQRVLEVGSYEGASACCLIRNIAPIRPLELHCVDTWNGGFEHRRSTDSESEMRDVEKRFDHNTKVAIGSVGNAVVLVKHKERSDECLARLLTERKQSFFDFVYVDASHQATDVICDAILGFKLLRIGGILAFDDYSWHERNTQKDLLRCPKIAIDAFTTIHFDKFRYVFCSTDQVYIEKLQD